MASALIMFEFDIQVILNGGGNRAFLASRLRRQSAQEIVRYRTRMASTFPG